MILHPLNPILNQSDEKKDKPGIQSLGDPFKRLKNSQQKNIFSSKFTGECHYNSEHSEKIFRTKFYTIP